MRIGVIGLGNMATAMLEGILKNGLARPCDMIGSAKTAATRERVSARLGIQVTDSNCKVAEESDLLLLAVKPQVSQDIIREIKDIDYTGKTIVSIMAGKTISWLTGQFGRELAVVRCMPNTPALVGEGCTGFCKNSLVEQDGGRMAERILESCGKAFEVAEPMLDVVVGASGSSPAYVFMFIEAMADGLVLEGMPRELSYRMALQAVMGSARLMLETGKHPGELKDMVCSPGGTTIAGVKALEENGFRNAVMEAVIVSVEKSKKL